MARHRLDAGSVHMQVAYNADIGNVDIEVSYGYSSEYVCHLTQTMSEITVYAGLVAAVLVKMLFVVAMQGQ